MQTNIELRDNKGFSWVRNDNISVKGYIFDLKEHLYLGKDLTLYFANIKSYADFEERVRYANGSFSVIYKKGDICFAACDCIRTFPLYYTKAQDGWIISDDPYFLLESKDDTLINEIASIEFLATGYVTGNETMVKGIWQVQAGAIIRIEEEVRNKFYFTYRTIVTGADEYTEYRAEAIEVFNKAFKRFIASLDGRTVVVPLSGGFDSRLIAAMLKKYEYDKVICFTYGRKGNPEIEISRKVAERLGFKWIYAEYTNNLIMGYLQNNVFRDYYKYAGKLGSMFFMQEYFAVKYLKENRLIPADSIFAPGHSGDFLGGSQIFKHGNLNLFEDIKEITRRIYRVKYIYKRPSLKDRERILQRIEKSIEEKFTGNTDFSYSIHEDWDFKEKLTKFNFNSLHTYTYFDYEFRFPYWDMEIINFFKVLPLHAKINKFLYDDILCEEFFKPYDLNFENELQPTEKQLKYQMFKDRVKYRLPDYFNRYLMTRSDNLFYGEITGPMVDDLASRGQKVKIHGNFYNSLIIQWYLEDTKRRLDRNSIQTSE